ncbi:MAG: hypothetical protein IT430_04215 [Phycisphaerales bacterium]|nr:hypothetical protein [Phycisphaerales bacterium]
MATSIFGLVSSVQIANEVVARLKEGGFIDNDVSVLLHGNGHGGRNFADEANAGAFQHAAIDAGAIVDVGETLGLLADIDLLVIPRLGAFIAAGPTMTSLRAIAFGAADSISSALVNLGLSELQSDRYDAAIRSGSVLVAAHARMPRHVALAKQVFATASATDVCIVPECPASAPRDSPPRQEIRTTRRHRIAVSDRANF